MENTASISMQAADHLADFGQAGRVGNAQVDMELALDIVVLFVLETGGFQGGINLRPRAVHQYKLHPQAVEQGEVVGNVIEIVVGEGFTGQQNDEHLPAVGVDVG